MYMMSSFFFKKKISSPNQTKYTMLCKKKNSLGLLVATLQDIIDKDVIFTSASYHISVDFMGSVRLSLLRAGRV